MYTSRWQIGRTVTNKRTEKGTEVGGKGASQPQNEPESAVRASGGEAEAISAESEMNTTVLCTEASITANVSASGAKLEKEQEEEMEFDNDRDLTGFRFIDCELLVQFVGSLLCPD